MQPRVMANGMLKVNHNFFQMYRLLRYKHVPKQFWCGFQEFGEIKMEKEKRWALRNNAYWIPAALPTHD